MSFQSSVVLDAETEKQKQRSRNKEEQCFTRSIKAIQKKE